MIADPGDTFFPYNVVAMIELFARETIDSDLNFMRRRLVTTDLDQSFATVPARWTYNKGSVQIGGRSEPVLQSYSIMVQTLIVDADEVRGLRTHSYLAKLVREMLARNGPLQVGLRGLTTTDPRGVTEQASSWRVEDQVFHNNVLDGQWRYLSTIEFIMETNIRN